MDPFSNHEKLDLRNRAQARRAQKADHELSATSSTLEELREELALHKTELEVQCEDLKAALTEAEQQRDLYRRLYEEAPVPYVTINGHGRICGMNAAGQTFFGVEAPVPQSSVIQSFVNQEDASVLTLFLRQAFEPEGPRTCKVTLRRDPALTPVLVKMVCTLPTGELCLALVDLTEAEKTQEILRQSEERLRLVHLATNDAVWDWDVAADILSFTTHMERLYGWTDIVLDPQPAGWWLEKIHPDDRSRVETELSRDLNDKTVTCSTYVYRFLCADGRYADVLDRAYVIREPNGTASRMIGAMADITPLKRAEHALRESEARFRTMADASPVIIWVTDAHGGIEFVNQAYRHFCGVTDDDVQERRWEMVVHPEDRDRYVGEFVRCIREQATFYGRCRILRADGEWRWIASYGAPRFSPSGKFLGHVGSSPDIHEIVQAQSRLEQWNSELEQAVRLKTVELTHSEEQLRALASELNLAEQRERKRIAGELHDHLQQLLVLGKLKVGQSKAAARAVPTCAMAMQDIDGILTEALQYTRTLVAELSPTVLHEHGLAAGLRWLGDYMKKRDMLVNVIIPENDDVKMPEDQTVLLFQSVRELLINSSKHSGTHEARVTLGKRAGEITVEVKDNGLGFDLAAAAAAADSPSGGLSSKFGLFNIRERMRALGGSFEIHSEVGKGTAAMLSLPVKESKPPSQLPAGPISTSGNVESASGPGRSNGIVRVLLVDDHAMVRQGLRSILAGYPDLEIIGEASNGLEALTAVEQFRPQVVIMDINMPQMGGIEATSRIKSRYANISVIGISVNAAIENQDAMLNAGASLLITKEAAVEQLYEAVQQVTKDRGGRVAIGA